MKKKFKYTNIDIDKEYKKEKWLVITMSVFLVAIVVLVGYAAYKEQQEWKKFSAEHNCKIISKVKGSTQIATVMTSDGKLATIPQNEPDKTAYLCDDGVTYWR